MTNEDSLSAALSVYLIEVTHRIPRSVFTQEPNLPEMTYRARVFETERNQFVNS